MLSLYRRHTTACENDYAPDDRTGDLCQCVIHAEGMLGDDFIRRSTKLRDWLEAQQFIREINRRGVWEDVETPTPAPVAQVAPKPAGTPFGVALEMFLADCEDETEKNLLKTSVDKYRTPLRRLANFCVKSGYPNIEQIEDEKILKDFRGTLKTWNIKARQTGNYISILRLFGNFCVDQKWWVTNYAKKLKLPKNYDNCEREPLTDEQLNAFYNAAGEMELGSKESITPFEVETFGKVMEKAGMAVADASLLQDSEVRDGKICYTRKKTRRNPKRIYVEVPLPPEVQARLHYLKHTRGLVGPGNKYYFCHGKATIHTATASWWQRLHNIFVKAGIENGTSHLFRHTFAHFWLKRGVDIEILARWMGHINSNTTRKYYSKWTVSRVEASSKIMTDYFASQPRYDFQAPTPEMIETTGRKKRHLDQSRSAA